MFTLLSVCVASVSFAAPFQGYKLSGPMTPSGDVRSHAVSPDGKRVVYLADQDVDEIVELWSVPTSGGTPVQLNGPLVSGGDVTQFRLVPGSTTVVYLADQESDGHGELYRVPIGGGAAVKLNPPLPVDHGNIADFEVSPDGTMVVYAGLQEEFLDAFFVNHLYSIAITGGTPILLDGVFLNTGYGASQFVISPDSSRVVFQLVSDGRPQFYTPYVDLYSVPIAGGAVAELCDSTCLAFHVTPDSSHVILTANEDTPSLYELYSVPIDGGPRTKLSPQLGGGYVPELSWCPFASCSGYPPSFTDSWSRISADSSRVVFTARESAGSLRELYSASVAGGTPTKLNVPPAGLDISDGFEITPDSSSAVYVGPRAGGGNAVYRVPIAGGASAELNGALVSGGSVMAHAESPDGSTVVYVADQDANDVFELYRVPIGGGAPVKLNPPLVAGGDVLAVGLAISADSRTVVYYADQDTDGRNELFRAPLSLGFGARKLNGPIVTGGFVGPWILTPDSRAVVYMGDQDTNDVVELYASPLVRSPRRSGPP